MRLIKVWQETNHFIVISNGIAFLVDAEAPTSAVQLPVEPVQLVTQAHDDSCIIADFSGLVCVDANGIRWFNNRLHADGFEGIDVQADRVLGKADIPPKGWTRFSLQLQDGRQVTAEPD